MIGNEYIIDSSNYSSYLDYVTYGYAVDDYIFFIEFLYGNYAEWECL